MIMAENAAGILKRGKGGLVLINPVQPAGGEIRVNPRLVREHGLVEGAGVTGPVKQGPHGRELTGVETIGGLSPEAFRARTPFAQLVAVDPNERFNLSAGGEVAMRAIDLMAPIGKGTRGLIVSPPKAGKTLLLEKLARAIRTAQPDARIVVLLIDERPEELTYFRRTASAEVFASSSDSSPAEHTALAQLMLAHIRTELECGQEVVVLLDSLTRLVRAFNLRPTGSSRTLSGGIDAGALEIPRRLFGLARNIEHGGSVTLLATLLVDTGSRQDQLIYEEFKGTGNSEIVLDRALAEARLFPAIDLPKTGTRREEYLYPPSDLAPLAALHRALAGYPPREALSQLLQLLAKYPTNEELLRYISSKS